jgi:hypothetical protein
MGSPRRVPVTLPRLGSSALREWERITAGPLTADAPAGGRGTWPFRAARFTAKALLVAVLPFLVLVRVAVFLYEREGYSTVLALAGGTVCTAAVVTAYAAWLWHRFTGRIQLALIARRFALPLVVAYCGYGLIYLSSANAKSERVRAYYGSLHPLLRVALSTLILADRDLVVTDLARGPEDYAAMGLAPNDGSLHYVQRDGYTHAADLRTAGRSELKNALVRVYFWSMGFATLRHVGSGDHLHVELSLR